LKQLHGDGPIVAALESLPALGAWIETLYANCKSTTIPGRSLHWERGLKQGCTLPLAVQSRRSLHWERGLKLLIHDPLAAANGRSLHWERGLKHFINGDKSFDTLVAPCIGSVD